VDWALHISSRRRAWSPSTMTWQSRNTRATRCTTVPAFEALEEWARDLILGLQLEKRDAHAEGACAPTGRCGGQPHGPSREDQGSKTIRGRLGPQDGMPPNPVPRPALEVGTSPDLDDLLGMIYCVRCR
jgi:hypothetical protein